MNTEINNVTFLFYANGHHELEPETWQSVVEIQNSNIGKQINVVVQVSREEQSIVKLLRPDSHVSSNDLWSGVRRYIFTQEQRNQFYAFDNINMADPNSLFDFIIWAVTNYPASKYVLSISGHIYQFVGLCPDYSGEEPLMMGFPEISYCIQRAFETLDATLDLLVLDTCYASTIEILYELGRYEYPRTKNVFTYIGKGPLKGLPYSNFIDVLESAAAMSTKDILNRLVNQIPINRNLYGLIALQVNHDALELIKQLFCKLASTYLLCKEAYAVDLTPEALLSHYREDYPWSLYLNPIHKLLKSQILDINYPQIRNDNVLPIHVLYQRIPDEHRKELYCRLSFSERSDWAGLLCEKAPAQISNPPITALKPIPMTKNILAAFLYASNEHISDKGRAEMVEELMKRKKWL